MIVLAGIVALHEASIERDTELRLKHAVGSPQNLVTTVGVEGALFVQAAPAERGLPNVNSVFQRDRDLFGAVARLDNRAELGDALGLASGELAREADAVLIRRMYERW